MTQANISLRGACVSLVPQEDTVALGDTDRICLASSLTSQALPLATWGLVGLELLSGSSEMPMGSSPEAQEVN